MAKWGSVDFSALIQVQKQLDAAVAGVDNLCVRCTQEVARILLNRVIKRTPVRSGDLRRGWMAGKTTHGSGTVGGKASIQVAKQGDVYQVFVYNSVYYAPYVEYGHRTANHKGWVQGQFMLENSVQELQAATPAILERLIKPYMEGIFK